MAEIRKIRYSYTNEGLSAAAISHAFRYLSAVSGIVFVEDSDSPELISVSSTYTSPSAKIMISPNCSDLNKTQIKDSVSDIWIPTIYNDPIYSLATKLSFTGKSGPYAHKLTIPADAGEKTLSALINDAIILLSRAGLITNESRPIDLWPRPSRFAMAITHDIDIPIRSLPGSLRLLLNRQLPGGMAALFDSLKSLFGLRPNPYDTATQWIELEKELDVKSTFFVFDGNRGHSFDPKYNPISLSKSFAKIQHNDLEIAFHSGIECYSGNGIADSKSTLEQVTRTTVRGVRPHYLSAFYPEYWRAASNAGFTYSSALGFDQNIGFWDGIDLPFYPFDKVNSKPIPILEIPIAIMDCGLIGDLPADSNKTFEHAMRLIDQCASTGGLIVLDWHERTLYNRDYPGWGDLFTKIVLYGKGKGAHLVRLDELAADLSKRFQG
jgi:peptidoglycan/xylan/chitin deacetylase (PgdA/CDA1 family)